MKVLDIAYYLIALSNENNFKITNLKLQKMLYFIQREEIKQGRIAFDDKIEAWQYGPVIPEVYFRFAGYGSIPIILDIKSDTITIPKNLKKTILNIFNENIHKNVWNMVDETHVVGNAWDMAYKRGYKQKITIQDIQKELGV